MGVEKCGSMRKVLCWLLTIVLVLSACPVSVRANKADEGVEITSPLVGENGQVTFSYYAPAAIKVYLAGQMNGWDPEATLMDFNEDTGIWSKTVEIYESSCEYKFVVDGNWVTDPSNNRYSNGNSVVYLDESENEVVEYLYSIYYLDVDHNSVDSASLWIWTDGVDGTQFYFDEVVTLSDDNTWLKASVKLPYDSIHIIPRAHDDWSWQDNTRDFVNTEKKDVNLYLVKGESTVSTALSEAETKDDETEDISELKSPVVKGKEVTFNYLDKEANSVSLAGEMNGWDKEATPMTLDEKSGVWSVTVEINQETCEYKFVVNGDNWVKDPLNEKQNDWNSIVEVPAAHVEVVDAKYTYSIYYYDEMHVSTDSAQLWIWTDGANGKAYSFDEAVTLEDGNTWLKATVKADFENVNIIPRAYESWSWQDVDKVFDNNNNNIEVSLYIVNGDATVYTEVPAIAKKEMRYVIVEYTRPMGDYEGWNIYSWNTGYGNETTADFEEVNGKMVAYLPVKESKEMVSFCMRRSDVANNDMWAEKDGGDHNVSIPLDQTIVKAVFVQSEGVTSTRAYNIGYETNVENGTISFYYRNDSLYKDYNLASLDGKVKLVFDNEEFEMNYDDVNERFFYVVPLSGGEHTYAYVVDGEFTLDKFNEATKETDGVNYSVVSYEVFDAEVEATITPSKIDYNDNAVIKVEVKSDSDVAIEIVEVYADLSALGLSSKFAISPELMAGTMAVRRDIATGVKEIPVTVKDQFGNIYTTTASVEVVARDAQNDFDWDEAVIYFAVTDRFFDGDATNNDPYGAGSYNSTMGSMYHGGDFAGLEQKLDYLKNLGINTIWITPIVENSENVSPANGDYTQLTTGYHGYWASNFNELNKHLGSEAEFKSLIDAMHKRGMKLMVDVVLNHAGYGTEDVFNNTFLPGKNMLRDKTTTISGDDKRDGLAGLPDFVTEDPEVRDLLVAWQTSWISKYDIDYYRVDTVKHVDDTTWKAFKNAITLVNPDFKMIGEYAGAGYATNAGQLGTGQMDAILDFDFNDKAIEFVTGNLEDVEKYMEGRNAGINNTATVGSFLGSHDEDGLLWKLINDKKIDSSKAYELMKVAASFMITAKGQPIIYYGEELGLTGANNWPLQENRYDMDWSKANDDNDMLAHYRKLLAIRNDNTDVFAKGSRNAVTVNNDEGVIVVNRAYGKEELFIGFNRNVENTKTVAFAAKADTVYVDLYSGREYTANAEGVIEIEIPAAKLGGTVVLKETDKKVKEEIALAKEAVEVAQKHLQHANTELRINEAKLKNFETTAKVLEKQVATAKKTAADAKKKADNASFLLKVIYKNYANAAQVIADGLQKTLDNVNHNIDITRKDVEHSKKYVADSKQELENAKKALEKAKSKS